MGAENLESHQENRTDITGTTRISVKGRDITSEGAHVSSSGLIGFQAKVKVGLGTSRNLASSFEHHHYEDDDWLFGTEMLDIRTERHSQQEFPTQFKAKEVTVNAGEGLTLKGSEIIAEKQLLLGSEGYIDLPPRVICR